MGPGAASISPSTREAAEALHEEGIPTVLVARPATGSGMPEAVPGSLYVPISFFGIGLLN